MAQKENPILSEAPANVVSPIRYMVTIKASYGKYITICRQNSLFLTEFVVQWLGKWGCIVENSCFEYDSAGLVHYYAIIIAKNELKYKQMMEKGWHIYIRRIFNQVELSKAHNYVNKTMKKEKGEYMFI